MNAIVIMAIGKKYSRHLRAVEAMFSKYARHCGADFVICDSPPDPTFKRNLFCQKMLLPNLYRHYEWIAFLDLDILISHHAPSIFQGIDDSKAFSAVIDQRGTEKFKNVVTGLWRKPSILSETHESYFRDRGFADHPYPKASINGGVWLCKPSQIAHLLREFYFSGFPEMIHEEAMMGYVAERENLFFEMDYRFNAQLNYELFTPSKSQVLAEMRSRKFRSLRGYSNSHFPIVDMYSPFYCTLVDKALTQYYFVHFSGGLPFINIPSNKTFTQGRWPADLVTDSRISRYWWSARSLFHI